MVFLNKFFEKVNFDKKSEDHNKSMKNTQQYQNKDHCNCTKDK